MLYIIVYWSKLRSIHMTEYEEEFLGPREAANFLSVSIDWLAGQRYRRQGPAWVKSGRAVKYRKSDLEAWAAEKTSRVIFHPTRAA